MLTPPLLVALPFLAWHPTDLLSDAVGYQLGLVDEAYPIAGSGLSALLLHIGVLTDPFGPAPAWATTLPATAVLLMGCWLVWSRPSPGTLLGVTGVVILGLLFFHRSFMSYYLDIPATALVLAALLPRPAMISGPVGGARRCRGRPTAAHNTRMSAGGEPLATNWQQPTHNDTRPTARSDAAWSATSAASSTGSSRPTRALTNIGASVRLPAVR
jgi:hypothetical protein